MNILRAERHEVLRKKKLFRSEFGTGGFYIFHKTLACLGDFLVIACFCPCGER